MKQLAYVLGSSLLLIFLSCVSIKTPTYLHSGSVKNFYAPETEEKVGLSAQEPVLALIFVPLHYEQMEHFRSEVSFIMERLKATAPFDEYKDRIASWIVQMPQEESQEIFKAKNDFPYLKVRMDFLGSIATRLNRRFFKIVIIDAKRKVSCAELSSLMKMSLIILGRGRYRNSDSLAKGFLHELGHSLGLRDESFQKDAPSLMGDADKAVSFGPANSRFLRDELDLPLSGSRAK